MSAQNNLRCRDPIRNSDSPQRRTPSPHKRSYLNDIQREDGLWVSEDDSHSLQKSSEEMTDDEDESIQSYPTPDQSHSHIHLQNISYSNKKSAQSEKSNAMAFYSLAIVILALIGGYYGLNLEDDTKPDCGLSLKDLHNKFPTIDKDLWKGLRAGVEKVRRFETPSVFIYLYNNTDVDDITNLIANYAVCAIRSEAFQPVILSSSTLNSAEAIHDYGHVIQTYRKDLQENGVLLVQNLEQVDGRVASAFHTICDEFTPFVPQSIILFTMKVEDFEENITGQVETILRKKWSVLEDDIFDPLFTRISSMIYKITV